MKNPPLVDMSFIMEWKSRMTVVFVMSVVTVVAVPQEQPSPSNNFHPQSANQQTIYLSKWPNLSYNLSWTLEHGEQGEGKWIVFHTMVDARVNWIGFGFASEEGDTESGEADWFIAWNDNKHRIRFKVVCHFRLNPEQARRPINLVDENNVV